MLVATTWLQHTQKTVRNAGFEVDSRQVETKVKVRSRDMREHGKHLCYILDIHARSSQDPASR